MSDELPLKDHQNEEVTQSFCQLKLLLKMHTAYPMQEKACSNSCTLEKFNFPLLKDVHT